MKSRQNQLQFEESRDREEKEPQWAELRRSNKRKLEDRDWHEENAQMRAALDMVPRGPDRRKNKAKHQGAERRRQPKGRRDLDNPKQQVW